MANEITFGATLKVVNGTTNNVQKTEKRSDQTTRGGWSGIQNIGTSEEVLVLSGVTAPRGILIENLDDTNYVDIGPQVAGALEEIARLYPGECCMMPLFPSVVIRAKANTAAVDVAYTLVET